MRKSLPILFLLVFVLLFASNPILASGGTLRIAGFSEPGNLNTVIWPTRSDRDVSDLIYSQLIRANVELEWEPHLAKRWEVSEDGRTYTFFLHENVKWHDGEPFTASDVAFTFKMLAHPEYDYGFTNRVMPLVGAVEFRAGETDVFEGIKVIDDYTVSFTTNEPHAPFLANLFLGILPEHILGDISPAEWPRHRTNRAPIGTGPFKFVNWEDGQYIELEANKDFFLGEPKVDRIFYRFGDGNAMLSAFINREIDITQVPLAEVDSVRNLQYSELKLASLLTQFYIGLNVRNDHFSQQLVRQAMAYAMNKPLYVDSVLGEFGQVSHDVFPDGHWSSSPNVRKYDYNPARAEELIQEAGYTKNRQGIYERSDVGELTFTIMVPTGNKEREDTAVLVKQDLDAIGIRTELQYLDFPTLVTHLLPRDRDGRQREVTADDYDCFILGYGVETDPDVYRPYFHSSFMPPNGYNFIGYSDPHMDELFDRQFQTIDFEERQQIFWEIGEKISEELPWVTLYIQKYAYVNNTRVSGFDPDFRGITFNKPWEWSVE